MNEYVFDSCGEKVFICHSEALTVDDLVEINRQVNESMDKVWYELYKSVFNSSDPKKYLDDFLSRVIVFRETFIDNNKPKSTCLKKQECEVDEIVGKNDL